MATLNSFDLHFLKSSRFGLGYDVVKADNAIYAVQFPENNEYPLPVCSECGESTSKNDHSEFCSVAINNRIGYIGSILRRKNIPSIELDIEKGVLNGRNGESVGIYSLL